MDADDALVVASQLKDSDRATLEQACHALADEVLRLRQVRQRAMANADELRRLRKIEWRALRVKATGASPAADVAEHILRGEVSDGEGA